MAAARSSLTMGAAAAAAAAGAAGCLLARNNEKMHLMVRCSTVKPSGKSQAEPRHTALAHARRHHACQHSSTLVQEATGVPPELWRPKVRVLRHIPTAQDSTVAGRPHRPTPLMLGCRCCVAIARAGAGSRGGRAPSHHSGVGCRDEMLEHGVPYVSSALLMILPQEHLSSSPQRRRASNAKEGDLLNRTFLHPFKAEFAKIFESRFWRAKEQKRTSKIKEKAGKKQDLVACESVCIAARSCLFVDLLFVLLLTTCSALTVP